MVMSSYNYHMTKIDKCFFHSEPRMKLSKLQNKPRMKIYTYDIYDKKYHFT